jgi:hypothetical protein
MTINIPTSKAKSLTKKLTHKTFKLGVKTTAILYKTGKTFVKEVVKEARN